MNLTTFLKSLDTLLMLIVKPIVITLCLIVAIGMTVGVFSRIIIGTPMFGLEEIILMTVMWLYMLGAVLASRERSHLAADFVQVVSRNPKVIYFVHLLASIISLIIAIYISTWCYDLMTWAFAKKQTTPVFNLPWYYSQSSLFVASLFFLLYLVRDIFTDLGNLLKK
ncbi:TRAP transporter small permease [Desulforhopalus singaporensis]|uniref:TRAP-type C4-dicarboxylate transport system, small permease component n=1 Tax=Desulforhopalus singaporensis TaxID=91360 RepID=A0A1H0VSW0_9BACT|nr:TRAP transporter small permease subunit [Desulforhopalus singaporensis]SDP81454.1 TRAP-type C4-dicarboxylate transport system, small permease component [Desulforhopalus singaporensis]